jgi:hypothetical protein
LNDLPGALERDNLVLAEVTAREIGCVTIVEALELTALITPFDLERASWHPHKSGVVSNRVTTVT